MQRSKELLNAVLRLDKSPDFQKVVGFMDEELRMAEAMLRFSENRELTLAQGKCQAIDAFKELIADSKKYGEEL
mgnify:CR=1 FL=1